MPAAVGGCIFWPQCRNDLCSRTVRIRGLQSDQESHIPFDRCASQIVFNARCKHERQIVNEAELAAALASRGFVALNMATQPPETQIEMMSRAEVIVSLFGSSLALAPLAGAGAKIVEILPSHVSDRWFIRLTGLAKQAYCPYIINSESLSSFHVDVQIFLAFIDR